MDYTDDSTIDKYKIPELKAYLKRTECRWKKKQSNITNKGCKDAWFTHCRKYYLSWWKITRKTTSKTFDTIRIRCTRSSAIKRLVRWSITNSRFYWEWCLQLPCTNDESEKADEKSCVFRGSSCSWITIP